MPTRIRLIRLDDGTILLGPFNTKPDNADPVLEVSVKQKTLWVKHSRRSPTPEQIENIRHWAKRMAQHQENKLSQLESSVGILNATVWVKEDSAVPFFDDLNEDTLSAEA